jgi:hypothetical protein
MSRGRPTENDTVLDKWTLTSYEVPSKPELGSKSIFYFDRSKSPNGCWKVEHFPTKGERTPKPKILKNQSYGTGPVVMVFKTSNRSNAKTKMKVWNSTNIDYIISTPKLPGVPDNAEILELGVGKNLIKEYKLKYNL